MATSHSVDRHDPALANLEILRQRLREALYAKKLRLRELAELCKRQRAELRTWVKERRAYALAELQNELRAARGAAQANRRRTPARAGWPTPSGSPALVDIGCRAGARRRGDRARPRR